MRTMVLHEFFIKGILYVIIELDLFPKTLDHENTCVTIGLRLSLSYREASPSAEPTTLNIKCRQNGFNAKNIINITNTKYYEQI